MSGDRRGRDSKLSKPYADTGMTVGQYILDLIEAGNYIETACSAAGITSATYYEWLRVGKRIGDAYENDDIDWDHVDNRPEGVSIHEAECVVFLRSAMKAQARSEAYAVAIIRKQMPEQWTAAMTYLERRYPARWKRRAEHEIAPASEESRIDEDALLDDPEAVAQIHDALRRVRGELPPG